MSNAARRREWAEAWPLPFVAMLGVVGSGLFAFSSGVFMDEMGRAFGWSKTDFTSAMTATLLVSLIVVPLVGRMIDRIGPRPIALFGIGTAVLGSSVLSLANGSLAQWWLLCTLHALSALIIVPPVWVAAVVGRFHASRGLALAVVLAGTGLGTAIWPVLAAFFVERLGWRLAYPAMALSWAAVMLPLTILFFRAPRPAVATDHADTVRHPGYRASVLSSTFLCLAGSGGVMILMCYGMVIHLVPILRADGLDLGTAAWLAGMAGLFSVIGRLVTGVLLDLLPSRPFAVLVFLLPVAVCLLLLRADGAIVPLMVAVALLGLATGAETDILTYVTSHRFDPALFGSLYAVIQTVLAVTSIGGSIVAGMLYDAAGSYDVFLRALIPLALVGATLIALVGTGRAPS